MIDEGRISNAGSRDSLIQKAYFQSLSDVMRSKKGEELFGEIFGKNPKSSAADSFPSFQSSHLINQPKVAP